MNVEELRYYCLSLPLATEDFPFDMSVLAFRICGKIFAMIDIDSPEWFVLKCDSGYANELREAYSDIVPAWHMNKKYWNQLNIFGSLPDNLIKTLINHSYCQVVKKLPRKVVGEYPELQNVVDRKVI